MKKIILHSRMGVKMIKRSISNRNLLTVVDESTQDINYGCNQAWYSTDWQRRAGCGPSVASNLFGYLFSELNNSNSKENWLSLMEDVWEYVTPTTKGMPTTQLFYESALTYATEKGLNIKYEYCDVPEEVSCRPTFQEILHFIETGLLEDVPVAFLNLCNGEEQCLYRWHWVTIIELECSSDQSSASVIILDEGIQKTIDLALWYKTTTLGGGFVYFIRSSQ